MYKAHVREYNGSRALHVCVMRVARCVWGKPIDLQIRPVITLKVAPISGWPPTVGSPVIPLLEASLRSGPWCTCSNSPTHQVLLSPPGITVHSIIRSGPVATIHLSRKSTSTTGLGFLILYEIMTFQLGFASRATNASHTLSCYPITAVD